MFKEKRKKLDQQIDTLLGEQTYIQGDVRFNGGLHLEGAVEGAVVTGENGDGFLHVSERGRVKGNVCVARMVLNGTIQGDIYCAEFLRLGPNARVHGNVYYALIEMTEGAEVNGSLVRQASEGVASSAPVPAIGEVTDAEPDSDNAPSISTAPEEADEDWAERVDGTMGRQQ